MFNDNDKIVYIGYSPEFEDCHRIGIREGEIYTVEKLYSSIKTLTLNENDYVYSSCIFRKATMAEVFLDKIKRLVK